jgi:hypothetical protein
MAGLLNEMVELVFGIVDNILKLVPQSLEGVDNEPLLRLTGRSRHGHQN